MKSKYWAIIILVALAVIAASVYCMRQPALDLGPVVVHHQAKTLALFPPSAAYSTPADNSGWNIYMNRKYGFEFQYRTASQIKVSDDLVDSQQSFRLSGPVEMYIYSDSPEKEAHNFLRMKAPATIPATEISGPMNLAARTIDGISGRELYGVNAEGHGFFDAFYFEKSGNIWQFQLDPILENRIDKSYFGETSFGQNADIYKKFWETFKLIEPEQPVLKAIIPGWETYFSEQGNYVVQYPTSYKEQDLQWGISSGVTDKNIYRSRLANKSNYKINSDCLQEDRNPVDENVPADSFINTRCIIISLNPYVFKTYSFGGGPPNASTNLNFLGDNLNFTMTVNAELDFDLDKQILNEIVSTFKFTN